MPNCPDKTLLRSIALGETPEDPDFDIEEHLSGCPACRSFLEACWNDESDAPVLPELADWDEEQAEFLPTLRTALSRSFRVSGSIRLEDFSFIESSDGNSVTGKIGDLELRELIGCGGMGAVFRAYDEPLEREVAVKVLRPEFIGSHEVVSLFLDEARAIAAIHHENILPIFDVARDASETPFYVMPLVEGGRLQDRIDEGRTFRESEAVDLALQIARGLSAAHEAGIIHRDIKPSNILLESTDPLRARLADFGLARAAKHGFGEGTLVGTPGYVAPEIAKGEKGTARADLYSFGVLFLQLLTGKKPLPDDSVPDPSTSGAPAPLVPLLCSLLSTEPEERPVSASEVAGKLEELETRRNEKTRQRESRAKLQRLGGWILGSVAVILTLGLAIDVIRGWPVSSSAVRTVTGKPISILGSPKAYSELSEAIAEGGPDCELVVSPGAVIEVSEPIEIENRKLHIRSSSLEKADLFFRDAQKGLFIAKGSELHLEGLRVRFRINARPEVEGMITLIESQCLTERCSLRRISPSPRPRIGATLFAMRNGGRLEIDDTALLSEGQGVGILAVNVAAKPTEISLNEVRFTGESLLHSVSSLPSQDGVQAEISTSISNSTIHSVNPFRIGRGGEQIATNLRIQNCIWQNMGPFLSLRTGPVPAFREHFSITATDSIFSIGTSKLIQVGMPDQIQTSTVSSYGLPSPEAEWNRFLGDEAETSLLRCEWEEWIFRYRRGQPIIWNSYLELGGKGATFADEEMREFQ